MVNIEDAWKGSGRKVELMLAIVLSFIAFVSPTIGYSNYFATSVTQPLYMFWMFLAFCAIFFYIVGIPLTRSDVPRRQPLPL
jgi:hypothetical protein